MEITVQEPLIIWKASIEFRINELENHTELKNTVVSTTCTSTRWWESFKKNENKIQKVE